MNKDKILRKSEDFSNIISNKQNYKNKYFSLYNKERKAKILYLELLFLKKLEKQYLEIN